MYNPEITKIINRNFELSFMVTALLKEFSATGNVECLDKAEELQKIEGENHRIIERMRGEN